MDKQKAPTSSSNLKLKTNVKIVKPVDENLKLPLSTRTATNQPRQLGTSRSSSSPASSIRIETLKKRENTNVDRFMALAHDTDLALTPRKNERATSVAAIRHGYLLQYRPPIVRATKPKNLNGPFYVFDLPQIRSTLDKQYRNNASRKKQDYEMTEEFFYDLKLDNYFMNEKNWNSQSKFLKSSSLFSAFNVYLPELKKTKVSMVTKKYIDSFLEKRDQEERLQTHRSQVPTS